MLSRVRRFIQQRAVLSFLAGIVLTISFEVLLHEVFSKQLEDHYGTAIGIIAGLTSLLIMFTIWSVNNVQESVKSVLDSPPFVGFSVYDEDEIIEAYEKMVESIKGAEKRIYILSAAFPSDDGPVRSRLSPARPQFLREIERVIAQKLASSEKGRLKYKRVLLSRSGPPFTDTLRRNQIASQDFDHCSRVFQMLTEAQATRKVQVELLIREPILSCPSILVVDDKLVHLAVMGEDTQWVNGQETKTMEVKGMVSIQDRSGRAAEHYIDLIDEVATDIQHIRRVESSDAAPESVRKPRVLEVAQRLPKQITQWIPVLFR